VPLIEVERRVRDLGADGLGLLLRYEREHEDRTPVVRLLTDHLRRLREETHGPAPGESGYGPAPRSTWQR
jgi:hypothetical protein